MLHPNIISDICRYRSVGSSLDLSARRMVYALILALIFGLSLQTASTVKAQKVGLQGSDDVYWGSWYIEADFSNHNFDITFWKYIGRETVGAMDHEVVHVSQPVQLKCKAIGQPYFDDGYLMLDGTSYIECQVPSTDAYFAAFREEVGIYNGCECEFGESPFWTSADIQLSPQAANGNHPVYAVDFEPKSGNPQGNGDIGLSLTNVGEIRTALRVADNSQLGDGWEYDPFGNKVWVGNGGGFYGEVVSQTGWSSFMNNLQQNPDAQSILMDPQTRYAFWEWAENSYGEPLFGPAIQEYGSDTYSYSTSEGILTIGYDPVTGAYFEGGIRAFDSEPGCRAY